MAYRSPMKVVLSKLGQVELRNLLSEQRLKSSGSKVEQIDRLCAYYADDLAELMKDSGWGINPWKLSAEEWFRISPRRSFAELADQMLEAATGKGARAASLRGLLEGVSVAILRDDDVLKRAVCEELSCSRRSLDELLGRIHGGTVGSNIVGDLCDALGPGAAQPSTHDCDDDDFDEADLEELDYTSDAYRSWLRNNLAFSEEDAGRELYPYQRNAKDALLQELRPGRPQILHLATGGGKTLTANAIARAWQERRSGPVLWVTKDWRLLLQAVESLCRAHRGVRVRRIGGHNTPLHPLDEADSRRDFENSDFIYSTLQTISRRQESDQVLSAIRPSLVVWDECHWGERGRARRILQASNRMEPAIPVLGLTATPRRGTQYEVAFSRSFKQLIDDGYLARPRLIRNFPTGASVNLEIRAGEVTRKTLVELERDRTRNDIIIDALTDRAQNWGKTIVFACTVDHAILLAEAWRRRRIPAEAVHSRQKPGEPEAALKRFRRGETRVLVNMDMLTHGIDVPDVQTVLLCRPTASDILFAQMIGRAARKIRGSGKETFNIVEFTDNMQRHEDLLMTAKKFFSEGSISYDMDASSASNSELSPPVGSSEWQAVRGEIVDPGPSPPPPPSPSEYLSHLRLLQHLALTDSGFSVLPSAKRPVGWWGAVSATGRSHALIVPSADYESIGRRIREVLQQVADGTQVALNWVEPLRETPEVVFRHFVELLIKLGTGPEFYATPANPLLPAALRAALDDFLELPTGTVFGLTLAHWLRAVQLKEASEGDVIIFPEDGRTLPIQLLQYAEAALKSAQQHDPLAHPEVHTSTVLARCREAPATLDALALALRVLTTGDVAYLPSSTRLTPEQVDSLLVHLLDEDREVPRAALMRAFSR